MKNTRKTGDIFENWAKSWLEGQGYVVWKAGRKAIYVGPGKMVLKGNDVFSVFDLLATEKKQLRFIQVTCHSNISGKAKEILAVPLPECELGCISKEIWQKLDSGEVKIFKLFASDEVKLWGIIRLRKFYLSSVEV